MTEPDRQLDTSAVARLAGIKPESLRRQRVRGVVPEPDGYLGTTPWWWESTIRVWLRARPARGQHSSRVS